MDLNNLKEGLFEGIEAISDVKNQAIEKIIDNLFKDEETTIQRTTDLTDKDLIWATKLEIIHKFLVDQFIHDFRLKKRCYELKNSIYRIRVSKDRLGRTENFDALKAQVHLKTMQDIKEDMPK